VVNSAVDPNQSSFVIPLKLCRDKLCGNKLRHCADKGFIVDFFVVGLTFQPRASVGKKNIINCLI